MGERALGVGGPSLSRWFGGYWAIAVVVCQQILGPLSGGSALAAGLDPSGDTGDRDQVLAYLAGPVPTPGKCQGCRDFNSPACPRAWRRSDRGGSHCLYLPREGDLEEFSRGREQVMGNRKQTRAAMEAGIGNALRAAFVEDAQAEQEMENLIARLDALPTKMRLRGDTNETQTG